MNKTMLLVVAFLLLPVASAYTFSTPTPYYYNGEENIKVNLTYIEQFKNFTPDYLRYNIDIEFTTETNGNMMGYAYCHSLYGGRIEITMFRNSWHSYTPWITEHILEHELMHAYQCRVRHQYPNHEAWFYGIDIFNNH